MDTRPSFIVSANEVPESAHVYPEFRADGTSPSSREGCWTHSHRAQLAALPPGTRSSWPHAEENEEEFVYVVEGEVDAWIKETRIG